MGSTVSSGFQKQTSKSSAEHQPTLHFDLMEELSDDEEDDEQLEGLQGFENVLVSLLLISPNGKAIVLHGRSFHRAELR